MKKSHRFSVLSAFLIFTILSSYGQPTSWTSRGPGGGGAILAASISPYNGNEFYLTCDMSNFFKTSDFGQSYTMTHCNELQVQHNSEIQFTSDPSKLFILSKPGGPYVPVKSYDGGATWINASNPCSVSAYQSFASQHDTDQVVISDRNKIYFSNTENTLGSFSTLFNYPGSYGVHIAGTFFENKDTVYICSHDSLIFTFNGGVSWSSAAAGTNGIPSDEHIVSFKGAKQGNRWVFYCVTVQANVLPNIYNSTSRDCNQFKGIYRLSEGETQWVSKTASLQFPLVDKGYLLGLADNDTSMVYVGGNSTYQGVTLGAIFKSGDGGNSFNNVFLTPTMFQSNDNITTGWGGAQLLNTSKFKWNGLNYILSMAVDPNNSSRLVCGDGMWVHTSIDNGANWQQAYTDQNYDNAPSSLLQDANQYLTTNLETTVSYWLDWSSPTKVFASYNDIVARRSTDGGHLWSFDISGLDSSKINDINMTITNPSTGTMYAAAGEQPGSNGDYTDTRITQFRGRISVSSDTGKTWTTLHNFSTRAVSSIAFDPNSTTNGMYATVIDVLGGIGDVYHCTDVINSPNTWVRLSSPPRTEGRPIKIIVLNDGGLVAAYGERDVSPTTSSFVFSTSSGIFYSSDGGVNWADNNPLAMQKEVKSVEIDPNDTTQNTWLAFVGSVSTAPGVYRTTDRGQTWTNVYSQPALSGTFHPILPNELYISTEINGLQYSINTNTNSFTTNPVSSYPFRRPQKVFFNPYDVNEVWVASFGNGFRVGTTNLTTAINSNSFNNCDFSVYPNPANNVLSFSKTLTDIEVFNVYGQLVISKIKSAKNISVQDLHSGIYFIRTQTSIMKFVVEH